MYYFCGNKCFKYFFHDRSYVLHTIIFAVLLSIICNGRRVIINTIVPCDGGGRFNNPKKNDRKPVKLQKESPAGCAGEGKQSKGK